MKLQTILDGIAKARQAFEAFRAAQDFVRESMPLIKEVMDTADALIPDGGRGQQKLDYVRTTVVGVWNSVGVAQEFIESVWPLVDRAITLICKGRKPVV